MKIIKILLVDIWIMVYRNILFPILINEASCKKIAKKFFTENYSKKKISVLIISRNDKWVKFWTSALQENHYVELIIVTEKSNLNKNLKNIVKNKQKFDIVLWYLSMDQYLYSSIILVKKISDCVARVHWDDEFNFFLPKLSSPLRDARRFDYLLSSSSLAVGAYRKLGFKSQLLFNGVMFDTKNKTLSRTSGELSKIVFVGSYTRARFNFLSKLAQHKKVFVYGFGWPNSDTLKIKGPFKNIDIFSQYDVIINLNFLSLSENYTHTKFRDFEFLGIGIPVLLHRSLENGFISEKLIYFNDFNNLMNILNSKNKCKYSVLNSEELANISSSEILNKTYNLIKK